MLARKVSPVFAFSESTASMIRTTMFVPAEISTGGRTAATDCAVDAAVGPGSPGRRTVGASAPAARRSVGGGSSEAVDESRRKVGRLSLDDDDPEDDPYDGSRRSVGRPGSESELEEALESARRNPGRLRSEE